MASVTLYVHSATPRELPDMDHSHGGPMRLPFMQANKSSSSLEGMERPVRSFKSFIKTVPPHPQATLKPLPPTPPPRLDPFDFKKKATPSPPISTPPPASPARSTSATSWKAPADWYEDAGTPPFPANRTLSPLLPEPSPLTSDMEKTSWLDADPLASSRLLPILERPPIMENAARTPPRSPPRTPLPAPPTSKGKFDEKPLAWKLGQSESDGQSPSPIKKSILDSDIRHAASSPVNSIHKSIRSSASANAKAFIALGISPPPEQVDAPENRLFEINPSSPLQGPPNPQYLRSKMFGALNKGSPLVDDSWEDTEMDEKLRQLSFSQDYHNLLADQYQGKNVNAADLSSTSAQTALEARAEPLSNAKHYGLVPRPLSWQKSGQSTPRIPSRNRSRNFSRNHSRNQSPALPAEGHGDSLHDKVQKRISSWVPHRLSVGPRRSSLQNTSPPPAKVKQKRKKSIKTKVESKTLGDDLRFSTFFPKGKPLKFRRKPKTETKTTGLVHSTSTSKSLPSAPLIRLPGGLALVRHSPTPAPKLSSAQVPSPRSSHPSLHYSPVPGSDRTSDPNPHTSWSSGNGRPSDHLVAPDIAARRANTRASTRSSMYSRRSASSTSLTHPLALELDPAALARTPPPSTAVSNRSPKTTAPQKLPRPPPPPLSQSSLSSSPPFSPLAWNHLRSWSGSTGEADVDADANGKRNSAKTGFISKAMQARRKHSKEARQERLKKSIRVLGPTDPGVVGSYVRGVGETRRESMVGVGERLPGYLVDHTV